MRPSRDDILERFKACAQKLGETPGRRTFCRMAEVKETDVDYYWPNPRALAREAGLAHNPLTQRIPEAQLFEVLSLDSP